MTVRIEYQPLDLSFEQFHRVDRECFPGEPIQAEEWPVAQDLWAAYESGSLVGFSYIVRRPDVAWLSRIGVAATHRRSGIATQLMQAMIEHCRQIGLPDMLLYVQSDNEAAIRLYRRFGFRPTESSYQFVWSIHRHTLLAAKGEPIKAVPIVQAPRASWPSLPREWANIAEMHRPPEQYVLLFLDPSSRSQGYCRLNPAFPGCFPFVVERPAEQLAPVLHALRDYLLPDKDILKLTFSSDDLADACTALGLDLNYRLFKMFRPGQAG